MSAAGEESSSSTPIPPPTDDNPRHRLGGLIVSRVHHSWEPALFTPPPPPPAPPLIPSPSTAFGTYRPPPLSRAATIPASVLRIGGSPAGRKRVRETAAAGGGGNGGGNVQQRCSVCNKAFGSSKALFGHMRSHPDRGWKGVHPPPAFRAAEEFADLRAAEGGRAGAEEEGEAGEGMSFRLPDLNQPPPPDSN